VTGGPETGDALVRHPGIDKISFTGGTATGRKIQAACAETLTPLVLELGGKSASIVFEDADVSRVIASAVQGIALLSGQVCVAPTRLLVHDALYGTITEHLAGALPSVKVGDPLQSDTVMGPVVSAAACERILDVIEGAQHDKAGTLLSGGRRLDGELSGGFFVEPTAFVDVDPASPLARDEIFGPVLAVTRFSTEDEAVELANDSSYGLAAYLHTTNFARAHRVAAALDAGNIAINGGLPMAGPVAPFGGFKDSGHGKEGGLAGIMEYLRIKNVNVDLS
jgi:aldehyde dehydrogenase (NAD+)